MAFVACNMVQGLTANFILKRDDGAERHIHFEEIEPGWILIKATTEAGEVVTPRITDHDRFDFNKRAKDNYDKKLEQWLKQKIIEFSAGRGVKVYRDNPDFAIAGIVAEKKDC